MDNRIMFGIIGIILILSGCLQSPKNEGQATPNATAVATSSIPTAVQTTAVQTTAPTPLITPAPTLKVLQPNTLYVIARMLPPTSWGNGKYELTSLKVEASNQVNNPLSIKAQIMNDGQVIEEKSFVLNGGGSNYIFTNEKSHSINSTNVTLRLIIPGYQPVEYKFVEASNLN